MNEVFDVVYRFLMAMSDLTGLSYNEANIVVYYMVLPFGYVFLADKIIKRHVLKLAYLLSVALTIIWIQDFESFSNWLFGASVNYLNSFHIFGWSYVVSSVWICVIFPGIVFVGMVHLAYPKLISTMIRNLKQQPPQDQSTES